MPKPPRIRVMDIPAVYGDVAGIFEVEGPVVGSSIFEGLIESAVPGPTWLIANLDNESLFPERDLADPHEAVEACLDVMDVLAAQHPVARTLYVRELAAKLAVDERTIRQSLNEAIKERRREANE